MKFIKEGLENGIIMPEVPFELVYGGGLREFGIAYLRDFSKYSKEARQEIIELIISTNNEDIVRAYLEDIQCSMYAWGGLMLFDIKHLSTEPRKVLIREMLLWKKWGVSGIDDVLYKVAFGLLYYGRCELFSFVLEPFEEYPRTWREKIVKGLLADGQANELERLVRISLTDLKCSDRYNCVQRRFQQMRLLTEFGRWQKWGLDLSFMAQELEHILSSFILNSDAVGFGTYLKSIGIKLDEDLTKSLIHRVNQSKFKKQHTKKMFLDSINKNRK